MVDPSILLKNWELYRIRGQMLEWSKSYSSDRSQYVSVLGCQSVECRFFREVPQSCIFGPILFLIYKDVNINFNKYVVHYAYGSTVYMIGVSKYKKELNDFVQI